MSDAPLWLRDLIAYSIQIAALVGIGAILEKALRLHTPRFRLAYWQALLMFCVLLPLLQPWRHEILPLPGNALNSTAVVPLSVPAPTDFPVATLVLYLILAGIAIRAAWMGLGLIRLALHRREGKRLEGTPEGVQEAQRLTRADAAILISPRIRVPVAFGYFRAAILLPTRFLEMGPETQKLVALHELLHVERRDWLWNLIEGWILTILWFEAPLWWIVRRARLSREQVVDAEAIRRSGSRRPYVKALFEIAGQRPLAEYLPASLFLRENQLAQRVAMMMKEVHMSRGRLTAFVATVSAVLLIAGASLAHAFPLKVAVQQTSGVASPQPTKSEFVQMNRAKIQRKLEVGMRKAEAARIKQAEIEKKREKAVKKAEAGQKVASRRDKAMIQQKIDQAMNRAKIDQKIAAKIHQAEIQRQIDRAMKQAEVARQAASRADIQKEMEALKKGEAGQEVPSPALRKLRQALKSAEVARESESPADEAKIQQQIEAIEEVLKRLQAIQGEQTTLKRDLEKLKAESLRMKEQQ